MLTIGWLDKMQIKGLLVWMFAANETRGWIPLLELLLPLSLLSAASPPSYLPFPSLSLPTHCFACPAAVVRQTPAYIHGGRLMQEIDRACWQDRPMLWMGSCGGQAWQTGRYTRRQIWHKNMWQTGKTGRYDRVGDMRLTDTKVWQIWQVSWYETLADMIVW